MIRRSGLEEQKTTTLIGTIATDSTLDPHSLPPTLTMLRTQPKLPTVVSYDQPPQLHLHDEHDPAPYKGHERKLVVAFDIGTTFSGACYVILIPGKMPTIQGVSMHRIDQNETRDVLDRVWAYLWSREGWSSNVSHGHGSR